MILTPEELTAIKEKAYNQGYNNACDDAIYEVEQISLNYLKSKLFDKIKERIEKNKIILEVD